MFFNSTCSLGVESKLLNPLGSFCCSCCCLYSCRKTSQRTNFLTKYFGVELHSQVRSKQFFNLTLKASPNLHMNLQFSQHHLLKHQSVQRGKNEWLDIQFLLEVRGKIDQNLNTRRKVERREDDCPPTHAQRFTHRCNYLTFSDLCLSQSKVSGFWRFLIPS